MNRTDNQNTQTKDTKMNAQLKSAVALFDARTGSQFARLPDLSAHDLRVIEQLCEPDGYNLPTLRAIFALASLEVTSKPYRSCPFCGDPALTFSALCSYCKDEIDGDGQ